MLEVWLLAVGGRTWCGRSLACKQLKDAARTCLSLSEHELWCGKSPQRPQAGGHVLPNGMRRRMQSQLPV